MDPASWVAIGWEDIESQAFASVEEHLNLFKSRVSQHASELDAKVEQCIGLIQGSIKDKHHHRNVIVDQQKQQALARLESVQKLATKIRLIVKLTEKVGLLKDEDDDDLVDEMNNFSKLGLQGAEEEVEGINRVMEMISLTNKDLKEEVGRRFEELTKVFEMKLEKRLLVEEQRPIKRKEKDLELEAAKQLARNNTTTTTTTTTTTNYPNANQYCSTSAFTSPSSWSSRRALPRPLQQQGQRELGRGQQQVLMNQKQLYQELQQKLAARLRFSPSGPQEATIEGPPLKHP